jgi:hypothetical protein
VRLRERCDELGRQLAGVLRHRERALWRGDEALARRRRAPGPFAVGCLQRALGHDARERRGGLDAFDERALGDRRGDATVGGLRPDRDARPGAACRELVLERVRDGRGQPVRCHRGKGEHGEAGALRGEHGLHAFRPRPGGGTSRPWRTMRPSSAHSAHASARPACGMSGSRMRSVVKVVAMRRGGVV